MSGKSFKNKTVTISTTTIIQKSGSLRLLSLEWSFKPLSHFIHFITGVQLFNCELSRRYPIATFLYRFLMFFTNLAVNMLMCKKFYSHANIDKIRQLNTSIRQNISEEKVITDTFSSHISNINSTAFFVLVHFFFLITSYSVPWKEMWERFKKLEHELLLSQIFFRKCKAVTIFGIVLLILVSHLIIV